MDILVSPNMMATDYKGCDNMTVVIIDFRKQNAKDQFLQDTETKNEEVEEKKENE